VSYELPVVGAMGTVGSGAAAGASAGGSSGSGAVSAVADAAGSIIGSIFSARSDIQAQRAQQRALAEEGEWSSASFLDDLLFGRQAEAMAREEARAQQDIQSRMGVQQAGAEADISRQLAQIRQSQVQQEASSRVGGSFGRGRALPTWAWVGLGLSGVGVTLLVIWLVVRRG